MNNLQFTAVGANALAVERRVATAMVRNIVATCISNHCVFYVDKAVDVTAN